MLLSEIVPHRRRRTGDVHAVAGADEIHGGEPDDERERRHDLEVDDRPKRQLPHALHVVAVSRDPDDERREDQRHDQQLDHAQKNRGEHLERRRLKERRGLPRCGVGKRDAHDDADHHRDEDPVREREAAKHPAALARPFRATHSKPAACRSATSSVGSRRRSRARGRSRARTRSAPTPCAAAPTSRTGKARHRVGR